MTADEVNTLGTRVVDIAFRLHTALGPGLLESAYVACLAYDLQRSGLNIRTEVPVPVIYQGVKLAEIGYRIDILVETEIVIEVKSLEAIAPVHLAQLVSYLKLANKRLGYLLNFNVAHMRDGIKRRANGL